jgi:membrane protease YdiL (CAAX protease family)
MTRCTARRTMGGIVTRLRSSTYFAIAIAAELAYLGGRTLIRPLFEGDVPGELAVTAWRVPFVFLYAWIFLGAFRAGAEERRGTPSHPLLWGAVALVLMVGPPAWGQMPLDWSASVFMLTAPIVALREELLYRAILQCGLERVLHPLLAILIATALFVASHAGWQTMNVYTIFAIAAGGLLFGVVYQRTRSLGLVVVLHTAFDCLAQLPSLPLKPTTVLLLNAAAFFGGVVWWSLDRQKASMQSDSTR